MLLPPGKITLLTAFLFLSVHLQAQVCTGSLGDPVVNYTFGTSSGGPLGVSTTNYSFTSSNCPNDGSYTVAPSTSGCFNNSWHTVNEDHTPGDVNGLAMLVNASFTAGDFYVDTVRGLCGGTTYEFAAWILNVLKTSACNNNGITPKLNFNIETTTGTVLGTYNTGNIPQGFNPEWKQYGLFFKTPAAVSTVVLRITNNNPGGCGNDLMLDDITFRPCGPTVKSVITGVPVANESALDKCQGSTEIYTLQGTLSTGYNDPAYQWQVSTDDGTTWTDIPGATGTIYTRLPTGSGVFKYRVSVAEAVNIASKICRVSSNVITITIHPLPTIIVTGGNDVCEFATLNLIATGADKYTWTGPNGFTSNSATPGFMAGMNAAGTYTIVGETNFGCVSTTTHTIAVNKNPVANITANNTICEGNTTVLEASGGVEYNWSPATALSSAVVANPIASPTDSTTYTVIVTDSKNCKDTASIAINVFRKPLADAGPDRKIMQGQSTELTGAVKGTDVEFAWTPLTALTNGNTLNPTVSPTTDFTYTLRAISKVGCGEHTDNVFIRVFRKVVVPNAFSPNGDGVHDTWDIEALETYPESKVQVFNRYGQVVFESNGYSRAWKGTLGGKPVPTGTYYYVIDLKNGFPLITGWLFILR